MNEVARFGIAVRASAGWEARLYRREALPGETTHPILHVATFPLPADRGDFGSGAVEIMAADDILVVLLEYHADSVGTELFRRVGLPRVLFEDDFDATTLQRMVPGHGGAQLFFNQAGRAFCLYVVLGSLARRAELVPQVNGILATLSIGAA